MIEESLYAFDIMPAATHLAASTLSNAHPDIVFGTTRIVTMPYGYDKNKHPHIGSLELIDHIYITPLLSLGEKRIAGRKSKKTDKRLGVPPWLFDIVIMNPPFTNPTNHEKAEVPVPSFAGFNTSDDEQKAMSARLKQIRKSLSETFRARQRRTGVELHRSGARQTETGRRFGVSSASDFRPRQILEQCAQIVGKTLSGHNNCIYN